LRHIDDTDVRQKVTSEMAFLISQALKTHEETVLGPSQSKQYQ
jgi:hypothetical protein